jgi:hypothetical protein
MAELLVPSPCSHLPMRSRWSIWHLMLLVAIVATGMVMARVELRDVLARLSAPRIQPLSPRNILINSPKPPPPFDRQVTVKLPQYPAWRVTLAEGDFVYIRTRIEGDGSEELFNHRDDPKELNNLARAEAMLPILRRFRDHLAQAKARGPAASDTGLAPRVAATPKLP